MQALLERDTILPIDEIEDDTEPQPSVKTPSTRLLDLLAGWSHYAQRDEDRGISDAPNVVDAICDLYQEGGNLVLTEAADKVEKARVLQKFLTERILPVLLREE